MRRISLPMVLWASIGVVMLSVALVTADQKQRDAKWRFSYYSSAYESYKILEASSLSELEKEVRKGLGTARWQPLGGIVYDVKKERYLQVMVNPGKAPEYP